jgi:hypothetical protein
MFEKDLRAEWKVNYHDKKYHAFQIGWFPYELKRSSFVLKKKDGLCQVRYCFNHQVAIEIKGSHFDQNCVAPQRESGHGVSSLGCVKYWTQRPTGIW